jgi:cytochrome c biogenesis protein
LLAAAIEVNKPLTSDGVAIYQASFGDGGTGLNLRAWDMLGSKSSAAEMLGRVNQSNRAKLNGTEYSFEFSDFRAFQY